MGRKRTVAVAVVVGALGFGAGSVFSQEKPRELTTEEMLKINEEKAALADEHRLLGKRAGTWDADCRIWTDPAKEPTRTKGTSTFSSILGGRYLVQEYSALIEGRRFEGRAIFGFDKDKGRHFTVWIDNMRTGIETAWEVAAEKGRIVTYLGEEQEWQGVRFRSKEVITTLDEDHVRFERFAVTEENEFKGIEILYTRRK